MFALPVLATVVLFTISSALETFNISNTQQTNSTLGSDDSADNDNINWHCFEGPRELPKTAPLKDCQKLLLSSKLPKRSILGMYEQDTRQADEIVVLKCPSTIS